MPKRILYFALGLFFSTNLFAAAISDEIKTAKYFDTIKSKPKSLSQFLKLMPKGGDLHNHLSGSIYAEILLRYAKDDDLCINKNNYIVFDDPQCSQDDLLNQAIKEKSFYNMLIDAWSVRNFQPINEIAPNHFFSAFIKFNTLIKKYQGSVFTEVVKQAAYDHVSYLELMLTPDGNQSGQLGKELGWNNDFNAMRNNLLKHNFDKIKQTSTALLNHIEASKNKILGCDTNKPQPACDVEVRYIYQVGREQPPEMVFAQMLAGFEIAKEDKRVVGLNLVQAEHGPISLRDYSLQMQMMNFLHKLYPDVAFSLHAGELNEAIAAPKDLTFHINEAVKVAHAMRIGHGVDITQEENLSQLLETMSKKEILVEVNLSSNAFILNAKGSNHPLPLYLNSGVPVTLSTDDQGINRSNLSKEYRIAVASFDLDYPTLKIFARNSLHYAFLKGEKLWLENSYQHIREECTQDNPLSKEISHRCDVFLKANEKAEKQWQLEKQFAIFERKMNHK